MLLSKATYVAFSVQKVIQEIKLQKIHQIEFYKRGKITIKPIKHIMILAEYHNNVYHSDILYQ